MLHIHIVVAFKANVVLFVAATIFFPSKNIFCDVDTAAAAAATFIGLLLCIYYHDNGLALGRARRVQVDAQVAGLQLSMNTFNLTMF